MRAGGKPCRSGAPSPPAAARSREEVPRQPSGSGLSAHILPTSATMIGVCMTVLSIGHLGASGGVRMAVDKLLAVDALIFLVSAFLSFLSMRSPKFGVRFEARAESVFIVALGMLALGAIVLAFSVT